jgi:hypothetical protein
MPSRHVSELQHAVQGDGQLDVIVFDEYPGGVAAAQVDLVLNT